MKEDIKERWVTALRSGEYDQGQKRLQINGQFCCLGVLCDLAVKEGVIPPPTFESYNGIRVARYAEELSVLPDEVSLWAGLTYKGVNGGEEHPDNNPRAGVSNLATYNDSGRPFTEIADLIEEHL